jgi:hypothetical protein
MTGRLAAEWHIKQCCANSGRIFFSKNSAPSLCAEARSPAAAPMTSSAIRWVRERGISTRCKWAGYSITLASFLGSQLAAVSYSFGERRS